MYSTVRHTVTRLAIAVQQFPRVGYYLVSHVGFGGGGYFLFFVNPFQRSALKKSLNDKGLSTQAFTFENSGLQAWSVRFDDASGRDL